jgi:hypothetical protein
MSELYRAAAAAAVLGSDERHGALLQSIADVARALFRAEAATIFLLDPPGLWIRRPSSPGLPARRGESSHAPRPVLGSPCMLRCVLSRPQPRREEEFG